MSAASGAAARPPRVRGLRVLLAAAAALIVAGCAAKQSPPLLEISGTVTTRGQVTLLPDTRLRVTLNESPRADAPAQFIAETTVPDVTQVPVPFRLRYDPAWVDPKLVYTLSARIERFNQLLFINDQQVRVLTGGASSRAEIVVVPASGGRN
ncbi:MAG: YbaY family lipoprotein [Burkholderiales bacterium]